MPLDFTDEEHEALTQYLREKLDAEKFRYSPRLGPIKSVLAKLDPPKPCFEKPEIPERAKAREDEGVPIGWPSIVEGSRAAYCPRASKGGRTTSKGPSL
jgi:hypothetical protein